MHQQSATKNDFLMNRNEGITSNNQRLANAGEDFFFAYLVNKRLGAYRASSGDFVCP